MDLLQDGGEYGSGDALATELLVLFHSGQFFKVSTHVPDHS